MASSDEEIHPNELDLGFDNDYDEYGLYDDDLGFGTPSRGFKKYFRLFFSTIQYTIKFAWLPTLIYFGAKESNISLIEAINVYGYQPRKLSD